MITMTMTLHITHAGGYLNDCHVVLLVCKYLMLFCHETTDWHNTKWHPPLLSLACLWLVSYWEYWLLIGWKLTKCLNWEYELDMTMTLYWPPGHMIVYYCISNKNLLLFSILHFVLELVNFSFLMSKKFYLIARELNPFSKVRIDFIKSSRLWTMIHRVN